MERDLKSEIETRGYALVDAVVDDTRVETLRRELDQLRTAFFSRSLGAVWTEAGSPAPNTELQRTGCARR